MILVAFRDFQVVSSARWAGVRREIGMMLISVDS